MEVTIERDGSRSLLGDLVYKVYIQFFFNDLKLDILSVPNDQISDISEKYISFLKTTSVKQLEENNLGFLKRLLLLKRKGIIETNISLDDLRTVNVITIDKFTNRTIGRTILELDADIVTLLSKDVVDKQSIVKLHGCIVSFVTQYLDYLTKKLMNNLKKLSNAVSIASFIPFGISLYFTFSQSEDFLRFFTFVIGTIATSLLYIYGPRMIIRWLIGHFVKTTLS